MKKPDLDSILKRARLPEIPEESLELFPRRLVARLKRHEAPSRVARSFLSWLALAFGLAACVLIAFAIGHWRGRMEQNSGPDVLANAKLIQETLVMFPNRVRAIVRDKHGLRLILSDKADVPASTPIYVRICDGKNCSTLVTFSGQEIQMAGQKVTVLADAQGGIILEGSHFVWSSTARMYASKHLKIEARNLGSATM